MSSHANQPNQLDLTSPGGVSDVSTALEKRQGETKTPSQRDTRMAREWRDPIKDMRPYDVLSVGVQLERMRRQRPVGVWQSLCLGAAGAGFGALLSGTHHHALAWALVVGGVVGWLALLVTVRRDSVNVADVCSSYLGLLDTWDRLGGHELPTNSEYVKSRVDKETPSLLGSLGFGSFRRKVKP